MAAALLIMLREGLEAALIVSIVLAYLRQIGRRDAFRQVWLGTFAAIGIAAVAGGAVYWTVGRLDGDARRLVFAGVSLTAVGVLTWMIFWMRKQARSLSRELRQQVDEALKSRATFGVATVAFVAVIREGLETALFMLAVLVGAQPLDVGIGGAIGLAVAILLGYLIYQGGRRINLRLFFNVTGTMVLIIAAGLLAKGVAWLQEAGVIPTYLWPVWNLSGNSVVGHGTIAQFLNGLLGWNPRPSIEELVVWGLYLVIFSVLFFGGGRPEQPPARATQTAAAGQKA